MRRPRSRTGLWPSKVKLTSSTPCRCAAAPKAASAPAAPPLKRMQSSRFTPSPPVRTFSPIALATSNANSRSDRGQLAADAPVARVAARDQLARRHAAERRQVALECAAEEHGGARRLAVRAAAGLGHDLVHHAE